MSGPTKAEIAADLDKALGRVAVLEAQAQKAKDNTDAEAQVIAGCVGWMDTLKCTPAGYSYRSEKVVDREVATRVLLYLAVRYGADVERTRPWRDADVTITHLHDEDDS